MIKTRGDSREFPTVARGKSRSRLNAAFVRESGDNRALENERRVRLAVAG